MLVEHGPGCECLSRICAGQQLAVVVRAAFDEPGSVDRAVLLARLERFEGLQGLFDRARGEG